MQVQVRQVRRGGFGWVIIDRPGCGVYTAALFRAGVSLSGLGDGGLSGFSRI